MNVAAARVVADEAAAVDLDKAAALLVKKLQWQIADMAVLYLQLDRSASYRDAAQLFRVGVHQLRARVNYRYGSLELLRDEESTLARPRLVSRKCMCCGNLVMLEPERRMCATCRAG